MNQREFAERVTAMQGSLYRVAASYLRGESDRLDAVAEAIAKAKENLAKGDLIPTNENYHGAVRLREKTPEEVSAERAARKITA